MCGLNRKLSVNTQQYVSAIGEYCSEQAEAHT